MLHVKIESADVLAFRAWTRTELDAMIYDLTAREAEVEKRRPAPRGPRLAMVAR